jgi:hypothetical protein
MPSTTTGQNVLQSQNNFPTANSGQLGTRLLTVADWPKHHAWPPAGGLRHLIFFAEINGFNKVIRRVGRRVLIDEAAFFSWVDQQGATK